MPLSSRLSVCSEWKECLSWPNPQSFLKLDIISPLGPRQPLSPLCVFLKKRAVLLDTQKIDYVRQNFKSNLCPGAQAV